uniref:Secreted protein n=1 Tax=Angiostrongylus cantonensis TaxID=6313 RepID=A0A0K0DJP3_ANGCA
MKVFVLACLASFVGATTLNNQAPRIKRSSSEGSFEEKLKEGNELLKNEPNANDTMELLRKLHNMEEEIKDDLAGSEKPSPEVLKAIEDYAKTVQNHKGDSIPEINAHNKVGSALFQGDMILTKEQADEILEDVKEDVANHKKQGTRSPE